MAAARRPTGERSTAPAPADPVAHALAAALAAGTREAFTAVLTDDVRWGGERPGGEHECTGRDQAGDHYAELLAAGVTLSLTDLRPVVGAPGDDRAAVEVFTALVDVRSPDPGDHPPQTTVRLTLREGSVAEIRVLGPPPTIEVLHVDGCPTLETFLPHLRALLAAHGTTTPITLTRTGDDDVRAPRPGSPTVLVDGHDVELLATGRDTLPAPHDDEGSSVVRRRGQPTTDGPTGPPADEWILHALVADPVHEAAVAAVHAGEVHTLQRLLTDHPGLASTRLARRGGRTLLHVATDWPGHLPDVAGTIAVLVAAGADPDAGFLGEHRETPLHWAASSDDVAALDALLDAGADIEARGAVIGGGTAMADATAFAQWRAARRLLDRGAATTLFEAACLGHLTRVDEHLRATPPPTPQEISSAFWGACHGGHVDAAAVLLDAGADLDRVGHDGLTPLDAAHRSGASDVVDWLRRHGATGSSPPAAPR